MAVVVMGGVVATMVPVVTSAAQAGADPVVIDDFEDGIGDWDASGLWNDESSTDPCGAMASPFVDGTGAAYFGDDEVCSLPGEGGGTLTYGSELVVPTVDPTLTFLSWYDGGPCSFDQKTVEVSVAEEWQPVHTVEGDPCEPVLDFQSAVLDEVPLDTPVQWTEETVDLSAYAGQSILLRFRFDSFGINRFATSVAIDQIGGTGWFVDRVQWNSGSTDPQIPDVPGLPDGFDPGESSAPCGTASGMPFTDVPDTNVHAANIACLAELGYTVGGPQGLPASSYGPRLETTREQMAGFIGRIAEDLSVALPDAPPDAFGDDDDSVHEARIDQLAAIGIIGGNGEVEPDYFPGRTISRGEMASFLQGLVEAVTGAALPGGPDAFTDDDGSPYEAAISALAAAGIVEGTGGGLYDPAGSVQRDSMATFLIRTLQYLAAHGHAVG